jgi:hypothetical protein
MHIMEKIHTKFVMQYYWFAKIYNGNMLRKGSFEHPKRNKILCGTKLNFRLQLKNMSVRKHNKIA